MQQFSVVYAEEITNENETIKYPTYEIFNYPDSVTNGQRATWGVTQGEDGRMYFANNAGVLMFDGTNWRIIQTENALWARSITKDYEGHVVVGTFGDIGVIQPDSNRKIVYKSIVKNKKDLKDDVIYEIIPLAKKKYFLRTKPSLYIIENGIVSKIRTPKGFKFGTSHKVGKDIYIYVQKNGLFKISNKNLELVKGTENFNTKKKLYI